MAPQCEVNIASEGDIAPGETGQTIGDGLPVRRQVQPGLDQEDAGDDQDQHRQ